MNDNQIHDSLNIATWSGAGVAVLGGVTLTEWLAIGGFCIALAGFAVNFWHKRQMVKIAREKLDLEKAKGGK